MKVSVSKSKNQTIYYLSKSVWVDGKSTTKTIEKIGSEDELLKVCGDLTPLEWAKQYAAKRSAEEKASKKDIMLKYSSSTLIKKESCRSVNVGYLFLKDIYYDLKIHDICAQIAEKYKFEFDLNQILSMLLFSRIIYPGSKRSSLELSKKFLEKPDCKLHHVYRALEILAKENQQEPMNGVITPFMGSWLFLNCQTRDYKLFSFVLSIIFCLKIQKFPYLIFPLSLLRLSSCKRLGPLTTQDNPIKPATVAMAAFLAKFF